VAESTGNLGSALSRLVSSPRALDLIRGGLALLLLWAAVSKLGNPTAFLGSLYAYDLPLPRGLLKLVAVSLPWVELLCGLLLLGRVWAESALWLLGGMLIVFLVATGLAWGRGLEISCGCFNVSLLGINPLDAGWVEFIESPGFAFVRNLILLAATAFLLRHGPSAPAPEAPLPAARRPEKWRRETGPQKTGHRRGSL